MDPLQTKPAIANCSQIFNPMLRMQTKSWLNVPGWLTLWHFGSTKSLLNYIRLDSAFCLIILVFVVAAADSWRAGHFIVQVARSNHCARIVRIPVKPRQSGSLLYHDRSTSAGRWVRQAGQRVVSVDDHCSARTNGRLASDRAAVRRYAR